MIDHDRIDPDLDLVGDGEVREVLGGFVLLVALAIPRRTRPLAGVLYGVWLSRAHGRGRRRLEATLYRLFDERTSMHVRADGLEGRLRDVEAIQVMRHPDDLRAALGRVAGRVGVPFENGAFVGRGVCPNCGSDGPVDRIDGDATALDRRSLTCRDCGATWAGARGPTDDRVVRPTRPVDLTTHP